MSLYRACRTPAAPSADGAPQFFSRTSGEFADGYRLRPEFRERFAVWSALLDKYAVGRDSALDLGCGSGIFSFYLAGKGLKVTGVDAADQMIALCEKEKAAKGVVNATFVNDRIPDLRAGVIPTHVSLLISSSVLEYVEDLEGALTLIGSKLEKGGVAIISMPNPRSLHRRAERLVYRLTGRPSYYAYVRHLLTPEDLAARFLGHGLAHIETQYYAHAALISRGARHLGLGARFTENLYVLVLRKA